MYRLLTGLYQHLTRKEEFNVIIIGLDNAGKTTFLERVKTLFNPSSPGLPPSLITPTIGQNIGRITLSSHHLLFWDLGGQKDLRSIWDKYFKDADAVCWVIDSRDRVRCGWEGIVDGPGKGKGKAREGQGGEADDGRGEGWKELENVLRHPHIHHAGVPVLVLANKQESGPTRHPRGSMSSARSSIAIPRSDGSFDDRRAAEEQQPPMRVEEIKEMFNRLVMQADRPYAGLPDEKLAARREALGVSEAMVMGVSALTGEGIREAVNWLFYRVAIKGHSRRSLALAQDTTSHSPAFP